MKPFAAALVLTDSAVRGCRATSGNNAANRVIKDHSMLPTAVTTVGSTAYVLEAKLNYQRDPALKGKDPGTFTAYAVPLK